MKVSSFGFLMISCLSFFCFSLRAQDEYLVNRLARDNVRYASFFYALDLLEQRNATILVETGTARAGADCFWGDGGSTVIFGHWAKDHHALLFSVDISPDAIKRARDATVAYQEHIHFVTADSIGFLENFGGAIDFLYLDSFDYDLYNPRPSQEHHLKEVIAAYPRLHKDTVIMIDDCALPNGGKGKLAIEYLLERGWQIVFNGYQVILIQ